MTQPLLPRCERCDLPSLLEQGAGSRVGLSRDILICSLCGSLEAMRDYHELPPIPPNEWPVKPEVLGQEYALLAKYYQNAADVTDL
jgi:hypothetical protein